MVLRGPSRCLGCVALLVACSGGSASDDRPPAQLPATSPPPTGRAPVPLTATTIEEFITFAGASGRNQQPYIRGQLDAARGDTVIVAGLLEALRQKWSFANGEHLVPDFTVALIAFELVKHLRVVASIDVYREMIWRPLPPDDTEQSHPNFSFFQAIESLEGSAAEGLACVDDDRARSLVDEVIRSHPDAVVRDYAARQLKNQFCKFDEGALNP